MRQVKAYAWQELDLAAVSKRLRQCFELEPELKRALLKNTNPGVQECFAAWQEKRAREVARLRDMSFFEAELWRRQVRFVAGLDEAGRGPLAGPVVAAAVILPPHARLWQVDDSKKLSAAKREELIKDQALAFGVGVVCSWDIDRYNILQGTKMAMLRSIDKLALKPQHLLIDALALPESDLPQTSLIKGDSRSVSIAAASILAKCYRDRLMRRYHELYPAYGFDQHKGYPTVKHCRAIREAGYCPIHRRTFRLPEEY